MLESVTGGTETDGSSDEVLPIGEFSDVLSMGGKLVGSVTVKNPLVGDEIVVWMSMVVSLSVKLGKIMEGIETLTEGTVGTGAEEREVSGATTF